jgi:hypothetical protein
MKKIALLASTFGLFGALAYGGTGCTVTTSSGDGGLFDDDAGTGSDTGTSNDSGSDTGTETDGGTCEIIGSAEGITFGTESCDSCMSTSCCAVTTTCYTIEGDTGTSDCAELVSCANDCANANAGDECVDACKAAHPNAVTAATDFATCFSDQCSTACQ